MVKQKNIEICIALNEAIMDEKKASREYEALLYKLEKTSNLSAQKEDKIREIIRQEKSHERSFVRIAAEIGCNID